MKQTNFLQRCIGISMIAATLFFGAGFLIRSVQTANAAPPPPEKFITEGSDKIGKYMMNMVFDNDGTQWALIWDTETGKSITYYYSGGWQKGKDTIPDSPLGN